MDHKKNSKKTAELAARPAEDLELSPADKATEIPVSRPGARSSWLAGKRGLVTGIGIGALVMAGATYLLPHPASPPPAKTQTAPALGQSVTVASVVRGTVARELEATGTVAAPNLLPVLPQTIGLQVQQILVEEGNIVKAGQVMAVLDSSVLQTQLGQAQAQLNASQATVQQRQADLKQALADLGQSRADVAQFQANLGEARANLTQARKEFQRYQYLANQGAISRQEVETRATAVATAQETVRAAQAKISSGQASVGSAQAKVSSAQASVNSAQADVRNREAQVKQVETQLAQTQVLAPGSGIVAEKIVRVGDVTSGNQKLFSIIQNGSLELQVKVPETQLPGIRVGSSARVTSDADQRIQLSGKVREIAPLVDPQTRQATVKIALPASPLLRSGMFLQAEILTGTAQGLTVPARAVLPQADGRMIVYRLEGKHTARLQPVEVGETLGGEGSDSATASLEIKRGLKLGDRVIVKGAGYLKDGDRVLVVSD